MSDWPRVAQIPLCGMQPSPHVAVQLFVTVLALVSTATHVAASPGLFGVDVSAATSQSTFECLRSKHNVTYAIVRAYRSLGEPDTACPATVQAAWDAGLSQVCMS